MSFEREKQVFLDRFLSELLEHNAAIFAGAGLSIPAGYVNWKSLLKPLADELGIDIEAETDLISLAQFHVNDNGRHRLNQEILDQLGKNSDPTENHKILARLPIETFWTTNYDKLIEKSIEQTGKIPDVKYTINQLATTRKGRDAVVYKMHGDVDHSDSAVITKDDYERYFLDKGPYVNALSGDLVSKTFLFIGFGLSDPNLDYVLSRIRISFKDHQRQHYCIFKEIQREDCSSDQGYQHESIRQGLLIKDLQRFNIKTILIKDYSEITDMLKALEHRYRKNTVFLSGSAHNFSPWDRESVERFLFSLGEILVDKGFRVASGVGLGIGNAFITGVIRKVYEKPGLRIADCAILRPFPQHIDNAGERAETWSAYREDLIGRAGVAIFFMGNKDVDGKTVLAGGVEEEFKIAEEMNLSVLPIGASGWMAKSLWDKVVASWDRYFPDSKEELKESFQSLGEDVDDPNRLLSRIIETLELI
ncbi:MAG: SIR2 family protein [Alcanivorax sp.]|nr:SIR2 family protein [Alcanivorax sp.]